MASPPPPTIAVVVARIAETAKESCLAKCQPVNFFRRDASRCSDVSPQYLPQCLHLCQQMVLGSVGRERLQDLELGQLDRPNPPMHSLFAPRIHQAVHDRSKGTFLQRELHLSMRPLMKLVPPVVGVSGLAASPS